MSVWYANGKCNNRHDCNISANTPPHRIAIRADVKLKIIPKKNKTVILARIICVLVTGMVRRFLKVSLSRSMKNSMAAITPIKHGKSSCTPYPITN